MGSRLELHEELCELLGSRNVYFQPPESLKLDYPCIVYSMNGAKERRANDRIYNSTNEYEVIVIDYDPDSEIPDKIRVHFPMCSLDRVYPSDNLNHTVLKLYY